MPVEPDSTRPASKSDPGKRRTAHRLWKKLLLAAVVAAAFVTCFYFYGDKLNLVYLAEQEQRLVDFKENNPILVFGAAFLVYAIVTGLSVPGAAVLTIAYGWFFGLVPGVILVSFASTTGATIAFLISRYLFRDTIQRRFGQRLAAFDRALQREGPFFLFYLRMIPLVPFVVINVVMGLTPIRTVTFWWVSQVGMLAGTCVYVFAGNAVPDLRVLSEQGIKAVFSPQQITQIIIAFVILALFPILVRIIMSVVRRRIAIAENSNSP